MDANNRNEPERLDEDVHEDVHNVRFDSGQGDTEELDDTNRADSTPEEEDDASSGYSDFESVSYSSDDESGGEDENKPSREMRGKWKTDLAAVTQESIPEDRLHTVSWGRLAVHTARNILVILAFVVFAVLARVPIYVSLPLFMANFLLIVACLEVLLTCQVQNQIFWPLFFTIAFGAGVKHFGIVYFMPYFARFLVVPFLLIVLVLWLSEKPDTQNLFGTRIWQAMSGWKYGTIKTKLDLAKLCKSMYHHEEKKTMKRFWDTLSKCGIKHWSKVRIQMVQVDENNPEISDVTLELNGQEFEPDKYLVTELTRYEKPVQDCGEPRQCSRPSYTEVPSGTTSGRTSARQNSCTPSAPVRVDDKLDFKDLESLLSQQKISDKLLDTWLNPAAWKKWEETAASQGGKPLSETSENGDAEAASSKKVEKEAIKAKESVKQWMRAATFRDDSVIVASFQRYSYFEGLSEHWAPCALQCLGFCAFLSCPAVHIIMDLAKKRQTVCSNGGVDIDSEVVCGNGAEISPCREACKSFLDFTAAFNSTFSTSNVELFFVFIMIPVFIFGFSVQMAQHEHNLEELIYLQRLRKPKKAIAEVMKLKTTLEDVLTYSFLFDRFKTSICSWRGADPALAACCSITEAEFDLTATKGYNNCLKQVMEPVTEIKLSTAYDQSEQLPFGVGWTDNDDVKGLENAWKKKLKYRNGLGDESGRNYKVLFDLQIYTEDAWIVFKDWCERAYGKQYRHITKNSEAQDAGQKAHTKGNAQIYDILLPNGFCLTHVFVQAMPDDGVPYHIELQCSKDEDERFWMNCSTLVHSIKSAIVDESDDDEEGVRMQRRLAGNPIIARFTLSEQYYNNMCEEAVKELCKDGQKPENFTLLCDDLLKPQKDKMKVPDKPPVVKGKERKNAVFWTRISVFMGDENPLHALLAASKACIFAARVWLECFCLAMLVPLFRWVTGKHLFPKPLSGWLIMNTVCIWLCLVCFFSDFHKARTRLSLISNCLAKLEQKTLTPAKAVAPSDADSDSDMDDTADADGDDRANADAEKRDNRTEREKAKAARAQKKAEEDARPFDLVVEDKTMAGIEYHPSDQRWKNAWKEKHTNVVNWHDTVSHLRVFVSTSRLVAQTMLVAAALIVGFLLLMSLLQMMNADNSSAAVHATEKEAITRSLGATAQAGQLAVRRLHEEVGDAMQALTVLAERAAVGHVATPTSAPTEEPISHLAARLRTALVPAHAALHGVLLQQHDRLAKGHTRLQKQLLMNSAYGQIRRLEDEEEEDLTSAEMLQASQAKVTELAEKMDFSKTTKTQIFTVVMVIFVMLYSVPLMWNMVLVNGFFDRHEDLLVKQKERHMLNHARRVMKYGRSGKDGKGEDEQKMENQDNGTQEEEEMKSNSSENESMGDQRKTEVSDSGIPTDPYCKRYEKTLDMTIEAAKKSRERFALKLFGFVISAQFLATWVCLMASPILSEAKQLLPGLALYSCDLLENSTVLEAIQEQMDVTNPSMDLQMKKSLHENVCEPLKAALILGYDSLPEEFTEEQEEKLHSKVVEMAGPKTRKLMFSSVHAEPLGPEKKLLYEVPIPDLRDIVTAWWDAHPSYHPKARYATGYAALQELNRAGDRLLVAEPAAVASAFSAQHNIYQGFAAALAMAKGHLKAAVVEEEDVEGLHGHDSYV